MPQGPGVLLGPGDDAAVVTAPDGRVVVSTDLLVEGRHFRRDWSSGYDVGRKAAAQNLADIAAMGATPTSLVVALGMPADLPMSWLDQLTLGIRDECALVGASVVGGDLARSESLVLGVTALGNLSGQAPVTRSGARPGHVVAVAGRLGHAAAGLALLQSAPTSPSTTPPSTTPPSTTPPSTTPPAATAPEHPHTASDHPTDLSRPASAAPDPLPAPGTPGPAASPTPPGSTPTDSGPDSPSQSATSTAPVPIDPAGPAATPSASVGPPSTGGSGGRETGSGWAGLLLEAVEGHRRPRPPYQSGPEAARLGASAMMDVSDGLLQDLGHIAKASGVRIVLDPAAFAVDEPVLAAAKELGADPLDWVLAGGEDHALVAVFPPEVRLPPDWRIVGRIETGEGVTVTGRDDGPRGWDHFKG
ncbi:AIR synthase related protein [Nonomuraea sp. NPDC050790]|uniref:AIR synthase related protein n=1 Tax=Nonomuraea sp. NPDC050790 TaxID=3364371 RepID=UPI0037BC7C14